MEDDDDHDPGLITKIWGPSMWDSMHAITFKYPDNPTDNDKKRYKMYFYSVGYVLPCTHCQKSYRRLIKSGVTKLDDNALKSKKNLTEWLYNVHEAVNKKLGVDYGVSFNDVEKRYNSYMIPCNHNKDSETCSSINLRDDSEAFRVANIRECPIISYDIAKYFIDYAKKRGVSDDNFYFLEFKDNIKKDKIVWSKRNQECFEIIKNMRLKGTPSIEEGDNNQWKGLPTIDELMLLVRLCSNLSNNVLMSVIKKIPLNSFKDNKNYKIIF